MVDTKQRWVDVGEAIRARMTSLAMSQADLVRESGVSDFTVRKLMRGEAGSYRPDRLAKVATALRWQTDAIDRILGGEQPVDARGDLDLATRLDGLESQMAELLAIVRRLDSPRDDG